MGKALDLTNQRFAFLRVINRAKTEKKGTWWNCVCDCGNTRVVLGSEMKRGGARSCGCSRTRAKDHTGQRFGRLVATRRVSKQGAGRIKWECICDCGAMHVARIEDMVAGKTTSCGCKLRAEREARTVGQRFGSLEVLASDHRDGGQWFYRCLCHACGNREHVVNGMSLTNGDAKSCGCQNKAQDLTGRRQGTVEVLHREGAQWLVKCACGKVWAVNTTSITTGALASCGCHNMFPNGRSKFERSVASFVESIGVPTEHNRRDLLPGNLELDIFTPNQRVAIECDGIMWHSTWRTSLKRARTRHETKTTMCMDAGIRLIHIREDWWANDQKQVIVKSILKHALGRTSNRVYARKCVVRTLRNDEFIPFANDNHLKGAGRSTYKVGLLQGSSLVAAASFMGTHASVELVRFVVKAGYSVVGGLSKLLAHSGYTHVHTYLDTGVFTGAGYVAAGFKVAKKGAISMSFVKGHTVAGRHQFTKPAMRRTFGNIDETKTQIDIAAEHGWHALFGCSQDMYAWNKVEA